MFAPAYFTGSRINEILSLDASAILSDRIFITVLKARKPTTREIQIIPALRQFLDAYGVPTEDYIFPAYQNSKRKTHVSRHAAHKVLNEMIDAAGDELEGVSTHSFKRSFATNLVAAGQTEAKIQRLLGHTSGKTTKCYVG